MAQFLISWLVYSLAVIISAYILPGVNVDSFTAALIAALVLGILNALIKPVLLALTLPINVLTLGLFTFVVNAALVLLASQVVDGFRVEGFLSAVIFAIVLSIISSILENMTPHGRQLAR